MVKKRFKKGSAAAKTFMKKLRNMRKNSKRKTNRIMITGIRAKTKIKRRSRQMPRKKKSYSRRKKSYGLLSTTVVPGFAYGATRQTVLNWLQPLAAKIPGGRFVDNIVMGVGSFLVSKYGKYPALKKIGKAGILIESYNLGVEVVGSKVQAATTQIEQSFR